MLTYLFPINARSITCENSVKQFFRPPRHEHFFPSADQKQFFEVGPTKKLLPKIMPEPQIF